MSVPVFDGQSNMHSEKMRTHDLLCILILLHCSPQCAEEKETRDIVYEHDGIVPIIDLLSLKEKNALAAATGAVWKCAQSEENARRYVYTSDEICSLVWHFCITSDVRKLERLEERSTEGCVRGDKR